MSFSELGKCRTWPAASRKENVGLSFFLSFTNIGLCFWDPERHWAMLLALKSSSRTWFQGPKIQPLGCSQKVKTQDLVFAFRPEPTGLKSPFSTVENAGLKSLSELQTQLPKHVPSTQNTALGS